MTEVSGVVRDTQGNAIPNAIVTAQYKRPVVGSNGGAAVQNARTFTADGSGLVTMGNMLPGTWDVYFFIPVNDSTDQTLTRAGTMVILDQSTQTLESALTETIGTITPSVLQQAIAAKDAAEAAADLAQSAYQGRQYETRAEFAADTGYAPQDGTVVTAGGVQYERSAGATALPGLPGWSLFGVNDVEGDPFVSTSDQTLTEEQQAQARENIGAIATYDTFAQFEADDGAGVLDGLASGDTIVVAGRTLVRENAQTFIPGLPNWRDTWMRQKHLLSADWQPRPDGVPDAESVSEVPRFQAVLDSIGGRHPDLTHAHVLGDLVYTATGFGDGTAPDYGFPEFLEDWRDRLPIPLSRAFFIPGNHDRDGTGIGAHQFAWSMNEYRSWIGPEYYYTVQGNLLMLYLGHMGGSVAGEITDAVVEWAGEIIRGNQDKNIILCLHHPLLGTYQGNNTPGENSSLAGSQRVIDILNSVSNVAVVFYGHVGSNFQFNDETAYGTRHIQIGMHIPSNVTEDRNDQYYVMKLVHGSSAFTVEQWDATADEYLSEKSIDFPYPLHLGEDCSHDGRDFRDGPLVHPHRVSLPLDQYRYDNNGTWEVDISEPVWTRIDEVADRARDITPEGLEVGWALDFPGEISGTGEADFTLQETNRAGITFVKVGGTEDAPSVGVKLYGCVGNERALAATILPEVPGLERGLILPDRFSVGTLRSSFVNGDPDEGFHIRENGQFGVLVGGRPCGRFRRSGEGPSLEFFIGGTEVGSIAVTTSSTDYNTTSDGRLKEDLQDFDGLSTILSLEVYDYLWAGKDARGRGVIAQDAFEVAPYMVTVGGDDPQKEPWTADYSKAVPDLIRAVQQLSGALDDALQRIETLEAQVAE